MDAVRLYEVFNAMRIHWNQKNYDFIKFKGRVKNLDKITLDNSKDKSIYYQVAKNYKNEKDFVLIILPLFLEDQGLHISTLLGKERCANSANEWYRKIQTMPTWFAKDCDEINKYIAKNGLKHQQFFLGNYILDFLLYDKINMETFIILNKFIFFLTKNKKDSIIYRQMYDFTVEKYSPFIQVDLEKYRARFEESRKKHL